MTDTLSSRMAALTPSETEMAPITEPHLAPMFATGSNPVVTNTAPHPSPIFDTGPHPDPLRPLGAEPVVVYASELEASELVANVAPRRISESIPEAVLESVQVVEAEPEFPGDVDLSGPDLPELIDELPEPQPFSQAFSELENTDTDTFLRTVNGHLGPVAVPAQPVVVPGSYLFVKRWKFAAITAGVWVLAAAAGLGFYYWWYTALDKTWPVFGILVYLAVCTVAGILVSMVPNRPQVSALAIALMAAPMASTAAAAVLHGAYYFEWIARPVMGPVIG